MCEAIWSALERLKGDDRQRAHLACNIVWGRRGLEAFFQRQLLGEVNYVRDFIAAPEQDLPYAKAVDLVLVPQTEEARDSLAEEPRRENSFHYACAFCEIKVAFARIEPVGYRDDDLVRKIPAVLEDIAKLRRIRQGAEAAGYRSKDFFALVLLCNYAETRTDEQARAAIRVGEKNILRTLAQSVSGVRPARSTWLLDREKEPSDHRFFVYAKAVILAV